VNRDAVIIEVGLNEAVSSAVCERVPVTPEACAADARACHAAGAAVIHWHARDPATGEQRLGDAALYGEMLERLADCSVLAYPSYPVDADVSYEARLTHVWELRERWGLELAPVDVGSVNVVVWDGASHRFVGLEAVAALPVIANPLSFVLSALDRAHALGMQPTLGAFDVGATRTMVLLAEAGRVRPHVLHKIFLSGSLAVGPFPTEQALDYHLAQIPAGLDVEWLAVPYAIEDPALIERICRAALERGGGVRVGLGDNPAAQPGATNAALVERAARWAAEAGRPVASGDDVRDRFAIGART